MRSSGLQISVSGLLVLVACLALNIWLFRVGLLFGLIGLNVTKHVAVAVLCATIGVNGRSGRATSPPPATIPPPRAARGVP